MYRAPTELLILQPTPFCNLDCSYCYLPQRNSKARMSRAVLEACGRVVLAKGRLADRVTVVWHAGEPCVLPAGWYREAFDILERHRPAGLALTHSFQTNATLIDEDWLRLLARDDVRLGVSLDGPEDLHDLHRKTRGGAGSFRSVMAGLERLRAAAIPFHVISVLSAASLAQPRRLARFFLDLELGEVCLNIEEIDGINRSSSLAGGEMEARYAAFLRAFLDELETAERPPWVREVQFCQSAVLEPRPRALARNHQVSPLAILSVDAAGRVSTFSPELMGMAAPGYGDFLFGEIEAMERPEDLLRDPALRRAAAAIEAGRRRCRSNCEYFRWCGGGAPANKWGETKQLDSDETLFCRLTIKTLLSTYLDRKVAQGKRSMAS